MCISDSAEDCHSMESFDPLVLHIAMSRAAAIWSYMSPRYRTFPETPLLGPCRSLILAP